jgi:hypothetical protein
MKNIAGLLILSASLLLVGCGAGDNTTAAENTAFKSGDKSAIKGPPPGANQKPANFHSSLEGESIRDKK